MMEKNNLGTGAGVGQPNELTSSNLGEEVGSTSQLSDSGIVSYSDFSSHQESDQESENINQDERSIR